MVPHAGGGGGSGLALQAAEETAPVQGSSSAGVTGA